MENLIAYLERVTRHSFSESDIAEVATLRSDPVTLIGRLKSKGHNFAMFEIREIVRLAKAAGD